MILVVIHEINWMEFGSIKNSKNYGVWDPLPHYQLFSL